MDNPMTTSQAKPRRRWLRVVLYGALLSTIAFGFVVHRAAAELGERSVRLGKGLENFAGLAGRTTRLTFNGAEFSVSTQVLDQSVDQALGRFIERCNQDVDALSSDLAREMPARSRMTEGFFQRLLVMRNAVAEGAVTAACLGGLGEGGLLGLSERAKRFAESGDVSELGQLRYAYMRGVAKRTHVILVSAEGPLQLGELFPVDSDVPGRDVVPGVRPDNSRRVFAAAATGTPHVMTTYRVGAQASAAISNYGQKLEAIGYKPVWIPSGHGTHFEFSRAETFTRGYVLGEHTVVASSQPQSEGGSLLAVAQIERHLSSDAGDNDEHR